MRYVLMYLLCGVAWMVYEFSTIIDHLIGEEGNEIYEKTKRELFKCGLVLGTEQVRNLIIGIVFIFMSITWPWQLLDIHVIMPAKRWIKKRKH